jgi:hypothetical protein
LKKIGKTGDKFLRGEDCFIDRIFELREYAIELLKEDTSDFNLKKEYFVFYSHQGYIFAFFNTLEENPPIYLYHEGEIEPKVIYNSFAIFLEELLNEHIKITRKW